MSKIYNVAVAGLGAVCLPVAKWLDDGVEGLRLTAVSASSIESGRERVAGFKSAPKVVPLEELVEHGDIIVEGLPPERYFDLAEPAIAAGKIFVAATVTQLLERMDLVDLARKTGARIIVPTGALAAFDAVRAASYGKINSLVMSTHKPPKSLQSAVFVKEQGLDLGTLTEPLCLYKGTVRDAAQKFPSNVNVAVALSLAGAGPDNTQYEVWADPALTRNTHYIVMDSDATHLEFSIAGVPSERTPGTGKLTPLSVMATLEGLISPLRIGA